MAILSEIFSKDKFKNLLEQIPEIKAWYRSGFYRSNSISLSDLVDVTGQLKSGIGLASLDASGQITFNGMSSLINVPLELINPFSGIEVFLKIKFISLPPSLKIVLGAVSQTGNTSFFLGHNTSNNLFLGHGSNSLSYDDNLGNGFTLNTSDYYIFNLQVLTTNPRFTVLINNTTSFSTNTVLVDSFASGNFALGAFKQGAAINSWSNFNLKECIFCSNLSQQKRDLIYNFLR